MNHHRHSFTMLVAAGGLFLAACSSPVPAAVQANPAGNVSATSVPGGSANPPAGGDGAGNSGVVTPCALLTQAEVDRAVGQPLGKGKATIPNYDCAWNTSDFTAGVSLTVSDWAAIKTSATTTGTATAVPGVGDEALTKGGGLLYVRKGNAGFLLSIDGRHIDSLSDHGLAANKVLAAAVVGRL